MTTTCDGCGRFYEAKAEDAGSRGALCPKCVREGSDEGGREGKREREGFDDDDFNEGFEDDAAFDAWFDSDGAGE